MGKGTRQKSRTRQKGTRKAPRAHASETALGTIANINGITWIVEKAGTTKRWNKATGYFTHDNGARPFYVKIRDGITVLYGKYSKETDGRIYDKEVLHIPKYAKVWIGSNTGKYANKKELAAKGNSLLVHISGKKYVYIGNQVFEFTAPDTIQEFHGILGFSDIVYAFAIGTTNTYYFVENRYLPLTDFGKEDPYAVYFAQQGSAKKIPGKMIQRRIE